MFFQMLCAFGAKQCKVVLLSEARVEGNIQMPDSAAESKHEACPVLDAKNRLLLRLARKICFFMMY
jgi:hypothetical protein